MAPASPKRKLVALLELACAGILLACRLPNPNFESQAGDSGSSDQSGDQESTALHTSTFEEGSSANASAEGETGDETSMEPGESSTATVTPSTSTTHTTMTGDETSESSSATSDGDSSATSDTVFDLCTAPIRYEVTADMVEAPMYYVAADSWIGIPSARVGDEVGGAATFKFRTSCATTVYVWGYIYDGYPGIHVTDSDSFFVDFDASPAVQWVYGCRTAGNSGPSLSWQLVAHWPNADEAECEEVAISWQVDAGDHVVRLRGREIETDPGVFSAVAALYLTTDAGDTPSSAITGR